MMRILRVISIDTDKERAYINDPKNGYSKVEKGKLNKLFDLFEAGQFKEAIKYTQKWTRDQTELIPEEVWQVLWDQSVLGYTYFVPSN